MSTTELTMRALAALEVAGLAYSTYDAAAACAASSMAAASIAKDRDTHNAVVAAGATPRGVCSPAHLMVQVGGDVKFSTTYQNILYSASETESDSERIVAVHKNASAEAARVAGEAVHAVAMSFYQRIELAQVRVHESVTPIFDALANLSDGPGGHGLVLCRLVSSLESVFRWGTVRRASFRVLGGCHARLDSIDACAPPKIPPMTSLGAVRWLPVPPDPLHLLVSSSDGFGTGRNPFMYVVNEVRGKYLVRLKRTGKLYVSGTASGNTCIASMAPMDISGAVSYGKAHMKRNLAEGISMHAHGEYHVRTVVENGVLQRCDVVV